MDWDDDWDEEEVAWNAFIPPTFIPPTFSAVHGKDFDTGETNPGRIFPVSHGVHCKGHDLQSSWYSEYYRWAYVRVPPIPFRNDLNVVWAKEEYL